MDITNQRNHISQQYNAELNEIRTQLAEMGGMVQRQVNDAIRSLIEADVERANKVVEGDHKVNRMEVSIDEECVRILRVVNLPPAICVWWWWSPKPSPTWSGWAMKPAKFPARRLP